MLIIRADGNAEIGVGHLMRCLTIAAEYAEDDREKTGHSQVLFVCAAEASAEIVRANGFRAVSLHTDYQDMESELPLWETILPPKVQQSSAVILVDSYQVTDGYLAALGKYGKVCLMDDMQQHVFPVDGVINYNIFADREVYQKMYGDLADLFIGSVYAPVRRQFLNRDYRIADQVTDILITTGGGDQDNIAGAILDTIYEETDENIRYHLVTGVFNPYFEELKRREKTQRGIHIYHNVKDMAGLMEQCQLAITAGGTTIYELASIGVPFICFSYAENQEAPTKYIGEKQIAGYAGEYHREPERVLGRMKVLTTELCRNRALREVYYASETAMIDGQGAKRLAQRLKDMTD